MTYNLRNGYSVRTTRVGEETEFQTLNPKGETISTVSLPRAEARCLIISILKGRT